MPLPEVIQRNTTPNFRLLSAGTSKANPTEMLGASTLP